MNRKAERLPQKLERFCPLSAEEKHALMVAMSSERYFIPGEDLVRVDHLPEGVFVILDGMACRYKLLPNSRREILGLLLPGDLCDLRAFLMKRMDHCIGALTSVTTALMPPESVADLLDRFPRVMRAFWWTTLVEDSITREWLVNVGFRTALERVAHLFCEIFDRLEAVGLTRNNQCTMPLTQVELADTLALSAVHVNRTLMYMRRAGLVRLHRGQLELLDRDALQRASGFDARYLHLDGGDVHVPGSLRSWPLAGAV